METNKYPVGTVSHTCEIYETMVLKNIDVQSEQESQNVFFAKLEYLF